MLLAASHFSAYSHAVYSVYFGAAGRLYPRYLGPFLSTMVKPIEVSFWRRACKSVGTHMWESAVGFSCAAHCGADLCLFAHAECTDAAVMCQRSCWPYFQPPVHELC